MLKIAGSFFHEINFVTKNIDTLAVLKWRPKAQKKPNKNEFLNLVEIIVIRIGWFDWTFQKQSTLVRRAIGYLQIGTWSLHSSGSQCILPAPDSQPSVSGSPLSLYPLYLTTLQYITLALVLQYMTLTLVLQYITLTLMLQYITLTLVLQYITFTLVLQYITPTLVP